MGLDMYAFAREKGTENNVELAYWRKHNALHHWMEELWEEKGRPLFDPETMGSSIEGMDFNQVPVFLTAEDLDRLEDDIIHIRLRPAAGFFFGSTTYTREDWEHYSIADLKFVADARDALSQGLEVFYYSWW